MDNQRLFLLVALGLILAMIWRAWDQQQAQLAPPPASAVAAQIPAPPAASAARPPVAAMPAVVHGVRIEVRTDVLRAAIDTHGGDLRELDLLRYPVSAAPHAPPFRLLADSGGALFIAQSGLTGFGAAYPTHETLYQTTGTRYELAPGATQLRVPLTWRAPDGTRYTKTYVFHRGSYVVDVEFTVANATPRPWAGYLYGQFTRRYVEQKHFLHHAPSYTGGAIYTPTEKYQKVTFADLAAKPFTRAVTGGWVAILEHYFVGSWMLAAAQRDQFYGHALGGDRYIIGFENLHPTTVAPGGTGTLSAQLYLGPKEHRILSRLAPGMSLTVDYGWVTVIAAPLFWLLALTHRWVGNWGWAIVILTVLLKLAFYPLSAASYKSMAQMRRVQPKLQALKERFGDDRQKMNQAMMELYKTEKINPFGGCLPIIIQIPVFIALYWVLLNSVEMRQAPFVLWIHDLSAPDPYYVLPIIMGATMFGQQLLNPAPVDPVQKKIFMVMPIAFTAFFLFFPAGLVLYWTVSNILSIVQQWRITRVINAKAK